MVEPGGTAVAGRGMLAVDAQGLHKSFGPKVALGIGVLALRLAMRHERRQGTLGIY